MRSSARPSCLLLALIVCGLARPAAAVGGAGLEGMTLLIQDLDGSNPVVDDTFTADGAGAYAFATSFDTGIASGSLSISGSADPGFAYELMLRNTRADGMPSNFDFGVAIEMVPFAGGVPLFGNMSIELLDTGGDGDASLTALFLSCDSTVCKPDPIVQFFSLSEGDIANNPTFLQDLDLGGTVVLSDGAVDFLASGASPAPDLSLGLGDWSEMGTSARFQLSHGDTVLINSAVGVVPEPHTALLLGFGLAGLAAARRRARSARG